MLNDILKERDLLPILKMNDGNIGYHLLAHRYFLSHEDLNYYIKFLKSKL